MATTTDANIIRMMQVTEAIKEGNLDALKTYANEGYSFSYLNLETAARFHRFDVMKYFIEEKKVPMTHNVFSDIIQDNITTPSGLKMARKIAQYLHEHDCPRDCMAVASAIAQGNMEFVEYFHEIGFTCRCGGDEKEHIECHNIPACSVSGQFDIVQYLVKKGYEYDDFDMQHAIFFSHWQIFDYLYEKFPLKDEKKREELKNEKECKQEKENKALRRALIKLGLRIGVFCWSLCVLYIAFNY